MLGVVVMKQNRLPDLADVENARLPESYEAAKTALAECDRLDECAEWLSQAEAVRSYARQSKDRTLENYAQRIRARAARRCGELLREFDGRGKSGGDFTFLSRREVASLAKLTKDQQVQVIRIAAVPHADFEAEVEARKPATLSYLASMGRRQREPSAPLPILTARDMFAAVADRNVVKAIDLLADFEYIGKEVKPDHLVKRLLSDQRRLLPSVQAAIQYVLRVKAALDREVQGSKPPLRPVK